MKWVVPIWMGQQKWNEWGEATPRERTDKKVGATTMSGVSGLDTIDLEIFMEKAKSEMRVGL